MLGEIEGIVEGQSFADRQALHNAGVHRGIQQGIGGGGESIVLSGGYVDDEDNGVEIIYTGQGGRDPNSGLQIADQELVRGNRLLAEHYNNGEPIRVIRGHQLDSEYAPSNGYRYDGLYRIDDLWPEMGRDGFLVYRFRLIKLSETDITHTNADAETTSPAATGNVTPGRSTVSVSRVIRDSSVGRIIKSMYDYHCQITGDRLDTPVGPYAEACHIIPVGRPHNGPDVPGNVLCLSPNMHVLFDKYAIAIADDFSVIGVNEKMHIKPEHGISMEAIKYHRGIFERSNH